MPMSARSRPEACRGREKNLASAEKARDVGDLAGVDPSNRPVDLVAGGDDPQSGVAEHFQFEQLAQQHKAQGYRP